MVDLERDGAPDIPTGRETCGRCWSCRSVETRSGRILVCDCNKLCLGMEADMFEVRADQEACIEYEEK